METVGVGIVGCGLMGREIASALARWCHLVDPAVTPRITAVCNRSAGKMGWFRDAVPSLRLATQDYRELLACADVDVVYIAVPHHLHEEMYVAALEAGKDLLGEKPFGIDLAANRVITGCVAAHPERFVRCVSQLPFYPGAVRIARLLESGWFGRIIEAETGFLHSSDLNPEKPVNWKRTIRYNGRYGCLGDLGMHICHLPFRAGWRPENVSAVLSNIMTERPDGSGGRVPCETWDNATLLCDTRDPASGSRFPWILKTERIAPGEMNTWYVRILGTRGSVRFSTKTPRTLERLEYHGGEQAWQVLDLGYETVYPAITGGIFEFGFGDALLQMLAAFFHERATGSVPEAAGACATPAEAARSHRLFTAALEAYDQTQTIPLDL